MWIDGRVIAAGAVLLLAACSAGSIGARDVDYSQQRAYDSDINASLSHGPTAARPGMTGLGEPLGAMPWQIPETRQ